MATTTIAQQLQEFLNTGKAGIFETRSGSQSIRSQFSNIDTMSCSLSDLTIAFGPAIPNEKLREKCNAITARLTYLIEPIVVVECDTDLATVQMRSNPPQTEMSGVRRYFELTATPSALTLRRYQKQPGEPRVGVDFVLTHEVAIRLVGDLLNGVSA